MQVFLNIYDDIVLRLRAAGEYVPMTFLRLILFWEFWEAGVMKYNGENWFSNVPWAAWQVGFPPPFDWLPEDVNWLMATWGELVFAVLLLLGLFTRFAAFSLLVITVVAMVAVHWPANWDSLEQLWNGYVITAKGAGNFKLPLLFITMLLPLIFYGGGKLSLDNLLSIFTKRAEPGVVAQFDYLAVGLMAFILSICTIYMFTIVGSVLLLIAFGGITMHMLGQRAS